MMRGALPCTDPVVDTFKDLGVIFNFNGNFHKWQKDLIAMKVLELYSRSLVRAEAWVFL